MLANVRLMERYRRAFYVEIMTGRDAGTGASRRGGVFGASGLEGFTGLGSGGFGRVGSTATGFGGTGAAQAGGYLGLLQNQQDIRNQQVTIAGLRSNLAQLRESLQEKLTQIPDDVETILRERLQIAQARQALLNAESRLLISQAAYQSTLDAFKIRLGLPPGICINISDQRLDEFNLIEPAMLDAQDQVTDLRNDVARVNEQLLSAVEHADIDGVRTPTLAWNDDLVANLQRLKAHLLRIRQARDAASSTNLERTQQDIERLRKAIPGRRRQLLALRQKYRGELDRFRRYGNLDPSQTTLLADIDPLVFNTERLTSLPDELAQDIQQLSDRFGSYLPSLQALESFLDGLLSAAQPPSPAELYAQLEQQLLFVMPTLLSDLSDDVLDLSLVQARARTEVVQLVPIDLKWDAALQIAGRYRRDWMNARAALVDSWRLIEFNADNLESSLDVVLLGDVAEHGRQPAALEHHRRTNPRRAAFRRPLDPPAGTKHLSAGADRVPAGEAELLRVHRLDCPGAAQHPADDRSEPDQLRGTPHRRAQRHRSGRAQRPDSEAARGARIGDGRHGRPGRRHGPGGSAGRPERFPQRLGEL